MSTLAEHIQKLVIFRKWIQPGEDVSLLLEDQEFRKEALLLCSVHLDELAALATQPPALSQGVAGAEGVPKLTEAQIEDCIDEANRAYNQYCSSGPRGQQVTPADDWKHWLARSVERAVLAQPGAGHKEDGNG